MRRRRSCYDPAAGRPLSRARAAVGPSRQPLLSMQVWPAVQLNSARSLRSCSAAAAAWCVPCAGPGRRGRSAAARRAPSACAFRQASVSGPHAQRPPVSVGRHRARGCVSAAPCGSGAGPRNGCAASECSAVVWVLPPGAPLPTPAQRLETGVELLSAPHSTPCARRAAIVRTWVRRRHAACVEPYCSWSDCPPARHGPPPRCAPAAHAPRHRVVPG